MAFRTQDAYMGVSQKIGAVTVAGGDSFLFWRIFQFGCDFVQTQSVCMPTLDAILRAAKLSNIKACFRDGQDAQAVAASSEQKIEPLLSYT